jgi:hypothetical protein
MVVLIAFADGPSFAVDGVASGTAAKPTVQPKSAATRVAARPNPELAERRQTIGGLLSATPGSLQVPKNVESYGQHAYRRAADPKISLADLETILRELASTVHSNLVNHTNADLKGHAQYFIKIYDEIYLPRLGGRPPANDAKASQTVDSGKKTDTATATNPAILGLTPARDEIDQLVNPPDIAPPTLPDVPQNRPASPQQITPTPAPAPKENSGARPATGASGSAGIKIDPALTRTGGNAPQKLIGNVQHNTVVPAGSAARATSTPSSSSGPSVSPLGSGSVQAPAVGFTMPVDPSPHAAPSTPNLTGASSPSVHVPTVSIPTVRLDLKSYERTVLDELKAKYPQQFSDPKSDSLRLARIIVPDAFKSDEDPEHAVERIKKVVDDFLRKRQETAAARAAAQRTVRRASPPREATSEPDQSGGDVDLGAVAAGVLAIGGAAAPMIRTPSVSVGVPAVRAPTVRAPAPVVRPPTSSSTITGISDIRVKRDIAEVGRTAGGLRLYRFRYLWSDTVYVGVMAQDVLAAMPAAVIRGDDGYLRVDYGRLGLRLQTFEEWSSKAPAATGGRS